MRFIELFCLHPPIISVILHYITRMTKHLQHIEASGKVRRTYSFPGSLLNLWHQFVRTTRTDPSIQASGAFLAWMALPLPLRDQILRLALETSDFEVTQAEVLIQNYFAQSAKVAG